MYISLLRDVNCFVFGKKLLRNFVIIVELDVRCCDCCSVPNEFGDS